MKINTENFKKYRERAVLSQTDVANKIGTKSSVISDYENGRRDARPKRIRQLAKVFKCEPDELILL